MRASKWLRWLGLGSIFGSVLIAGAVLATDPGVQSAPAPAPTPTRALAETGKALFVAKGCNMCHTHAKAPRSELGNIGPNLTNLEADPDYLRRWLANPKAIKPATQMPNLNLSGDEIEALVAFLTAR
jgi:cytochrome c oxidase subunit 2